VALVVFWPSTIINSVRVHNDALAAPLLLTAVYFISRWDRENRSRDFYLALTATAAALLTKATGYAVAATLVTIAGLRAWRARSGTARFDPRSARSAVIAAAVVAGAALLASVSRPSMAPHNLCQKVLGRACDVPDMVLVGNRPLNYLAFDVGGFLHGRSGLAAPPAEDYFWNGLFESSLFGVMPLGRDFDGRFPAGLAVLLRGLLLAMVAVGLLGLAGVRRVTWSTYRAIAAATAIMLVCLLGFRMLLPTPFHEDFRHIFPTLVPLCLGYAKIVERAFRRRPRLGQAGALLAWLMVAASALFFLRL
jgi:4-amino-4-deoxy-L-arabinose transferase-like glycosyltransferase